ncbi:MAG: plasmid stabilization protein [Alphaproteobacteria bacterium]|nr:plasmid stabilization protein [Alphaproteobacteria bacterium]
MGQILIRNIDAAVLAALRKRAAASGTSTEEQARRALAKAVGLDRDDAVRRLDEIRKAIGRPGDESVVADLRRDRRRDEP